MRCPNCNVKLNQTNKYCPRCGKALSSGSSEAQLRKKKQTKESIILVSSVVALAVMTLILYFVFRPKPCKHEWVVVSATHADCENPGTQVSECSVCGETKNAEVEEARGHKPQYTHDVVEVKPTCKKSGSAWNMCSVCGEEYSVPLQKLSHDYKNGVCTLCGQTQPSTGSGSYSSSSDSGVRLSDAEAFTVAQAMVKQELKSPSTAKFCTTSQATITHDGDKYTVKGWVDAQNSFGATLRSNWTCKFTAVKSGSNIGGEHGSVTFD